MEIGHNTNIWASRNGSLLSLAEPVGILPMDAPANAFFGMGGVGGVRGSACAYVCICVSLHMSVGCSITVVEVGMQRVPYAAVTSGISTVHLPLLTVRPCTFKIVTCLSACSPAPPLLITTGTYMYPSLFAATSPLPLLNALIPATLYPRTLDGFTLCQDWSAVKSDKPSIIIIIKTGQQM